MRATGVFAGIIFFLLTIEQSFSQEIVKGYFRSPLDIPLFLSGGFGEHRANHFHTGLDIKTQGVEGKTVYAAADGFVVRIRKNHYGYGNALYLVHPNGFTTVYGHLSRFNSKIEKYVRQQQYIQETEEVDLDKLPDTLFKVKKGEVIAYSGNSGSSGGPHLHFEIRETATENPLNPLLFGFNIADNIPPRILHIKVYPLDDTSSVEGTNAPHTYDVVPGQNGYILKTNAMVNAYGRVGIAIHTNDQLDGSGNICGIYELELNHNGEKIFGQVMSKLDFKTNRYINTHADYHELKEYKRDYHKSFINGNNQLPIYTDMKDSGRITVNKKHFIHYTLKDGHGNKSELKFSIVADGKKISPPATDRSEQMLVRCTDSVCIGYKPFKVNAAARTFYYDFWVKPEIKSNFSEVADAKVKDADYRKDKRFITDFYIFGDEDMPVQEYYSVSIYCPEKLFPGKKDKILLAHIDESGSISDLGGIFAEDYITAKARTFGKFALMIDTVPPLITPLNNFSTPVKTISISVGDNLSGIKLYKAYIDGKWVLSHYNVKKDKISINLGEEGIPKGEHELEFVLTDERGNESRFKTKFTY
ncbi:MAG: M23 family metallopeptidase [Bacteroidota bacterium]